MSKANQGNCSTFVPAYLPYLTYLTRSKTQQQQSVWVGRSASFSFLFWLFYFFPLSLSLSSLARSSVFVLPRLGLSCLVSLSLSLSLVSRHVMSLIFWGLLLFVQPASIPTASVVCYPHPRFCLTGLDWTGWVCLVLFCSPLPLVPCRFFSSRSLHLSCLCLVSPVCLPFPMLSPLTGSHACPSWDYWPGP